MAQPRDAKAEEDEGPEVTLVSYRLGDEEFGSPIEQIREVLIPENITRVPKADHSIVGVTNLRGQILTLVDMRRRLGFEDRPSGMEPRALVIDTGDRKPVGFLVDSVSEVLRIPASRLEPAPPFVLTERAQEYLTSVVKMGERLLLVCDLNALTLSLSIERGA